MKTLTKKAEVIVLQSEAISIVSSSKKYEKRTSISEKYFRGTVFEQYWVPLIFGLILASFIPGADFGPLKIPDIQGESKSYLLAAGLILLAFYLLCHIAWFKNSDAQESTVNINATEAEVPGLGTMSVNHRVRNEGVNQFIKDTSGVNLFSEHFHELYDFKDIDMQLIWAGNAPSGERGSLVFNIIRNPLLKRNITLVDYANELYSALDKTGVVRNRNVSTSPNMNIAVQWYIISIPDNGKLRDVHQLCKIVVIGEWLAYLFASYTDEASPKQKSVLLETFENFGS